MCCSAGLFQPVSKLSKLPFIVVLTFHRIALVPGNDTRPDEVVSFYVQQATHNHSTLACQVLQTDAVPVASKTRDLWLSCAANGLALQTSIGDVKYLHANPPLLFVSFSIEAGNPSNFAADCPQVAARVGPFMNRK